MEMQKKVKILLIHQKTTLYLFYITTLTIHPMSYTLFSYHSICSILHYHSNNTPTSHSLFF